MDTPQILIINVCSGENNISKIIIEKNYLTIKHGEKEKTFCANCIRRVVVDGKDGVKYNYEFYTREIGTGGQDVEFLRIIFDTSKPGIATFCFRLDGVYDGFSANATNDIFFNELKDELDNITKKYERNYCPDNFIFTT